MESTLLFLAACLMFSGARGESQSMSCSMVNGKTICNRQTSQGGAAMASSMSSTGMGPDYQSTYAGAGGPTQWDSSGQTVYGGSPGGYGNPSSSYGYTNTQQAPSGAYGGPMGVSSFSSSGPAPGGFVGGGPMGVSSFSSSGPAPGGFVGGFAVAGGFPFFGGPGSGYPPQGSSSSSSSSSSSGGAPAQGPSYGTPPPIAAGPMSFVNQFMGGGGGAFGGFGGAGAFAGAFPFGRR